MRRTLSVLAVALVAAAAPAARAQVNIARAPLPGESHLTNIRQLTNTGTQAEAYFSRDGRWITFQSTRDGRPCDQQYVMKTDGTGLKRVSNGKGKTTCGWFLPDGKTLFFGSSHANGADCPAKPDPSKGYVWGLDPFDIYTVNRDGTGLKRITNYNTYTAEGVLSPDGKRVVFTSLKDGDLDIYTMNVDGTDVRQLTHQAGYDGGPWWTHDGTRLIFSSNYKNPRSGNFDLFMVGLDGSGLEQITTDEGFDGFPMFSPDGKKLIWVSQRVDPKSSDVNLFIADFKP